METYKIYKQKFGELFEKYRVGIGLVLSLFIIFSGTILMIQGANAQNRQTKVITSAEVEASKKSDAAEDVEVGEEKKEVVFDIEGAVKNPGVYRLAEGSVLVDAINVAGGFSTEADTNRISKEINQASVLGSNSKIYIFKKSDKDIKVVSVGSTQAYSNTSSSNSSVTTEQKSGGKININTANLAELDKLSGIGPAIAQRIIDWREANGGFEIIEDVKKVKGIGDSLFEKMKEFIVVE